MIGIIAGMGAFTTSDFLQKIINHTHAQTDQDHIPLVIFHVTDMPDRTRALYDRQLREQVLDRLTSILFYFRSMGVTVIAVPCNTVHIFLEEALWQFPEMKLLHIVDISVNYIRTSKLGNIIGLLATNATVDAGLYQTRCAFYNQKLITPYKNDQDFIQALIYKIKQDKQYVLDYCDKKILKSLLRMFIEKGATAVILGCTELPLIAKQVKTPLIFIDTTDVLAHSVVTHCSQSLEDQHITNVHNDQIRTYMTYPATKNRVRGPI